MACYAVLVSVVELLDDIILHHEDRPHFRRHMPKLLPIITSLHQKFSFLEESVRGYASKGDKDAERVEAQIRDAAYAVQHIIESRISEETESNFNIFQLLEKAEEIMSNYKIFRLSNKVEREIDRIKGELADIQGRQRNENLQRKYDPSSPIHPSEQIPVSTTTMVGFDQYLTTIKDQLYIHLGPCRVISIVGTGGIGKTTLTKYIFDDAFTDRHFDCRAWVTISQKYNAQQVFRSLMKSLGVGQSREEEEGVLIFKHLKGRRYFIVLDDMWDTKVWDDLMHIFPKDDNNGSRIMLTTRLLGIAEYARTSNDAIHQMQFLSKEDSWKLFQTKAFAQNGCPLELENTGKSIINKCGGLPLAIIVIAGVLSNDKTSCSWKKIETNLSAILSRTDRHFCSILSFSYSDLPHQLKACFLYMRIFPEDYKIKVSDLIKLWVAEGFLKSTNGSKTLEEVGEEWPEDLVARNLVIITKRRRTGQFKYCVLHDLLRDLCREKAVDECFFHVSCEGRNNFNPSGIKLYYGHRFAADDIVHSVHHFLKKFYSRLANTRTDIFKRLRVLNVGKDLVDRYSSIDILRMYRLKFLKVDALGVSLRIRQHMFMSHNLQTIIISNGIVMSLPVQIWKMTRLRHLIIDPGMSVPHIPSVFDGVPIPKLEYLQTLMTFHELRFSKEFIKMIPNLRKVKTEYWIGGRCHLKNLVDLHCLEELGIDFHLVDDNLPLSLAFPQNLKVLSPEGSKIPWKLMTMVGSLPKLQVLRLTRDAFVGEEWEPKEGEFQSLKYLKLHRLDLRVLESRSFPLSTP